MNAKKLVVLTVALGLFAISSANVHAQMHRQAGFAPQASTSRSFAGPRTGNVGTAETGAAIGITITTITIPFSSVALASRSLALDTLMDTDTAATIPTGSTPTAGYYGGGYYGGGGYYNSGYYGNGYNGGGYYGARGYSSPGYGSYSYGSGYGHQSSVARLQQQLARAGYYRGSIDGIMGPRTRYALRAYQHDHGAGTYGMTDR